MKQRNYCSVVFKVLDINPQGFSEYVHVCNICLMLSYNLLVISFFLNRIYPIPLHCGL